jgi:antitoxin MazE
VKSRVVKWESSLAVCIPGPFAKSLGLEEGTYVELRFIDGAVVIKPGREPTLLDELVAGITPENVHRETDWGKPVGRES